MNFSLYFVWYNFVRIHKSPKVTPAMAAGLTKTLWEMKDIGGLIDAAAPKPGPPWLLQAGKFKLMHHRQSGTIAGLPDS